MSASLLNRRRMLQRLVCVAAMVLCLGQAVADAHLHLDEIEEEACTVCAFSDPGQILIAECIEGQPSEWRRSECVPVFSAVLSPCPFEVARSRAPPIS